MEKLLLHVCCAPCSIMVIENLKDKFELILYFYNPNIHPFEEYEKRLKSFIEYSESLNIKYLIGDYNYEDHIMVIDSNINNRCSFCYQLRLNEVAKKANELKIEYFSTTLFYSIYQNHETIKKIGEFLAKEYNLNFISLNLKDKYYEGRKLSIELNLYRQKYCGCIFSQRIKKEVRKDAQRIF